MKKIVASHIMKKGLGKNPIILLYGSRCKYEKSQQLSKSSGEIGGGRKN